MYLKLIHYHLLLDDVGQFALSQIINWRSCSIIMIFSKKILARVSKLDIPSAKNL